MATFSEKILVEINTQVTELSQLVNLRTNLVNLRKVGVNVSQELATVDERLKELNVAGKDVTRVFGQFKFDA